MRNHFTTLLCLHLFLIVFSDSLLAQANYTVTINNFPLNYQLYPRDQATNQGSVRISGSLSGAINYSAIFLKIYRQGILLSTQPLPVTGSAFNFLASIPAELANYRFELYGSRVNAGDVLLKNADNVVAGDHVMINGQSNAVSQAFNGDANTPNSTYRPFIRVYGKTGATGSSKVWSIGNGNLTNDSHENTGQWGMVMAAMMIANHQIPIAIINGADGGHPISFFQKAASVSDNYNRLYDRMVAAGLKNITQHLFFYQGETDANDGRSKVYYKDQLQILYNSWKNDYPSLKYIYLYQIRIGCGATITNAMNIIQAQKEFAEQHPESVRLISTNNLVQNSDVCHFPYVNGYYESGRRSYWLINHDLYNQPFLSNQTSPYPLKAYTKSGEKKVYLELKNETDTYSLIGNLIPDLRLEGGSTYAITNLSMAGNILTISYNVLPVSSNPPTRITLLSHQGSQGPALSNSNGIGLISFLNLPIEVIICEPSVITTQPVSKSTCVNVATILSTVATGNGLIYQWQVNNGSGFSDLPAAGADAFISYTGGKSANLNLTPLNTGWNGYTFRVIVSGSCSPAVTSNVVTLTVNPLPTVPTLSAAMATNPCPVTTANIAALISSTLPASATLEFYSSNTPIPANIVLNPTSINANGTYYAFYKNASGCYSAASQGIVVTITIPCSIAPIPDLRPLVNMTDRNFINPMAMSKPLALRIANVGAAGSFTSGVVTVLMSVGSNFTAAIVGSSAWTLTDNGAGEYTLTASVAIPRTSPIISVDIPLVLTGKSFLSKGNYNIIFTIANNAGGETNNVNNTVTAGVNVSL